MIISKNIQPGLLLLLTLLSACESSENSSHNRPPVPVHQVEVMSVRYSPMSHQQTVSGTLEAITSVRLYNEESGRITALPFSEGDVVKQGETIITLDGALIQAELDKAVAERKQAKADLRRIRKLVSKKMAAQEALHHSETTLNVAAAEEKLQRIRFSRTILKAPFAGIVTERNHEVGDVIPAHSHVLSLIDPTTLRLKIQLAEQWIPLLHVNDKARVGIDALGQQLHDGIITRIHPTINPNTRKGTVEITLNPVPENAVAGQLARAVLITQPVERLVIPTRAIRHDMNGAYVFRISRDENNNETTTVQRSGIEKGLNFGDMTEIKTGLNAGDDVIIKGFLGLNNNKQVKIRVAK